MRIRAGSTSKFTLRIVMTLACGGLMEARLPAQAGSSPVSVTKASTPGPKWQQKRLGKGAYSSIVIDAAGNPHVVFDRETSAGRVLTHAWAEGSHWFSEPIDSDPGLGYDNSIAIDGNGDVHVAYAAEVLQVGWKLKYARRTGGVWASEFVDDGGLSSSIAIDDEGFAHIVHLTNNIFRQATQTASGWDTEDISGASWSAGSSLILRDGNAYATFSADSLAVELAIRDADIWTVQQIDDDGRGGSMAFDQDGVVHVVYRTDAHNELRHAWLSDSGWQIESLVTQSTIFGETVPPGLKVIGDYPALVADSTGRLQLAFTLGVSKGNASGYGLVGASLEGGLWTVNLSKGGQLGGDTSIAVAPNGLVQISTAKSTGSQSSDIVAVRLKGARLSLSVVAKAGGTISVSPSGLETTGKASELVYPGTELMLTATPAQGFTFVKWSPAALGTDPVCNVTMDHDRKITAHFKATSN